MIKTIAIIGAGISGMSTALLLSKEYYRITIFAKAFSPCITSDKAAAFWFPYHIRNDKRGIKWCKASYELYMELSRQRDTGISMHQLIKVIRKGIKEEEPVWIDFMPEGAVKQIVYADTTSDLARSYDVLVPLIETQIFLPYLRQSLEKAGVIFVEKELTAFDELSHDYDAVINCSALGATKLCNDTAVIPVRGQVALLSPRNDFPVYLNNEKPLYIVPRKDAMIIGGTYEEGIDTETTDPATIERILKNAYEAFPVLKEHTVMGSWAGIRPYRAEVRVELEQGTNIIHNYGHGGSGFTLAFGCAAEVKHIVESLNSII